MEVSQKPVSQRQNFHVHSPFIPELRHLDVLAGVLQRLAVMYRGRALLVVWRVLKRRSASVALSEYREMLLRRSRVQTSKS